MKNTEIVMYESDDAAVHESRTLTGWWSRGGRYWGEDEHMARWSGSTHRKCKECGTPHSKSYIVCSSCGDDLNHKRWMTFEEVDWDERTMVAIYLSDQFFESFDDVMEYCAENDIDPLSLDLVICEGRGLRPIEDEYWCDDLAEDGEVPEEIRCAIDELNHAISKVGPVSWCPVNKRIDIGKHIDQAGWCAAIEKSKATKNVEGK